MTVHVFHLPVIFDNEFSKKKKKKKHLQRIKQYFLGRDFIFFIELSVLDSVKARCFGGTGKIQKIFLLHFRRASFCVSDLQQSFQPEKCLEHSHKETHW